jgi:hypothetical protein
MDPKVHCRVQGSSPLDHTTIQFKPALLKQPILLGSIFYIIPSSTYARNGLLSSCLTEIFMASTAIRTIRATSPVTLIILDMLW